MLSSGRAKAATLALAASLLTVVIATTASNAGSGPRCGGKPATIVRGAGDDDIYGTNSADVIVAGGGDDYITADEGRDRVCAKGGNDIVYGGEGGDPYLSGGRGNDYVEGAGFGPGSDGSDKLLGGRGERLGGLELPWGLRPHRRPGRRRR